MAIISPYFPPLPPMTSLASNQFIMLPPQGIRTHTSVPASVNDFFATMQQQVGQSASVRFGKHTVPVRVLDAVRGNGATLIEILPEHLTILRAAQPGLRIVPLVYYYPAVARKRVLAAPKAAQTGTAITLSVITGQRTPVADATVVAFTDFDAQTGASGVTNTSGEVQLNLGFSSVAVARLYIYPKKDCWGLLQENITLAEGATFNLKPIKLNYQDSLRSFYPDTADTDGQGATVGVLDTGAGPHPDLTIAGGANTVTGEDPEDFEDNGAGHGTHVAGIIAARGNPPKGIRGVAPGVTLRIYRVFGENDGGASNFSIIKAIDQAVADGCDLINMSLGGGDPDQATNDAISDAYQRGTVCIVAAGNDGRQPVSFPASSSLAQAVSALGRTGTFPKGTIDEDEVLAPFGTDKKNFVAAFSNIGATMDFTGPGVGVISTVPGGYGVLSGTSMACPAVTGAAARLLANAPDILNLPRDQNRAGAIVQLLASNAAPLGFGAIYEGRGLLQGIINQPSTL